MIQRAKSYSIGEEIFNSVSHGVGAILAVVGCGLLMNRAAGLGYAAVISCAVYGFALFMMYTMSSLYHAVSDPKSKAVLRIFDHCTIFLLITGTYAPYTLVTLGGWLGVTIISVLVVLTIVGIILNAVNMERFKKLSMLLYVAMGWCIIAAFGTLVENLALPGIVLLLMGGVVYTLGIVFYKMKGKKYMHSVWHLFVLCGSILQFLSIYLYVLA